MKAGCKYDYFNLIIVLTKVSFSMYNFLFFFFLGSDRFLFGARDETWPGNLGTSRSLFVTCTVAEPVGRISISG